MFKYEEIENVKDLDYIKKKELFEVDLNMLCMKYGVQLRPFIHKYGLGLELINITKEINKETEGNGK